MSVKTWFILLLANGTVVLSPIFMAWGSWVFSGFEGSWLSEGGPGHGAYLWFFFYSLPAGLLLFFAIAVVGIILHARAWYRRSDPG